MAPKTTAEDAKFSAVFLSVDTGNSKGRTIAGGEALVQHRNVLNFVMRDLERVSARNRDLRGELEAKLLVSKQLLDEVSVRTRELAESLTRTRLKLAFSRAEPINTSMVVRFPENAFTVEELEQANPSISREEVRMHLAYCVSLRRISFHSQVPSRDSAEPALRKGSPVRLLYRVIP